jgi:hypothetical protein
MVTAQVIPEALKKACVYDSEGNILLKESVDRLYAQLGATPPGAVVEKKEPRYADTTGKPVRDLETGILYPSQAKAAKALAPGAVKKDGTPNHFAIYTLYTQFPGRFAKVINGREVIQGTKPVVAPVTTPATTETVVESPESPLA